MSISFSAVSTASSKRFVKKHLGGIRTVPTFLQSLVACMNENLVWIFERHDPLINTPITARLSVDKSSISMNWFYGADPRCPPTAAAPAALFVLFPGRSPEFPYSQSARQIGHVCLLELSQVATHCKWKAWPQVPKTTGDSSPGNLTPGGHPSKADWQIPQTSSSLPFPTFQVHLATPWNFLIRTRNLVLEPVVVQLCAAIGVSLDRLREEEEEGEKVDIEILFSFKKIKV